MGRGGAVTYCSRWATEVESDLFRGFGLAGSLGRWAWVGLLVGWAWLGVVKILDPLQEVRSVFKRYSAGRVGIVGRNFK